MARTRATIVQSALCKTTAKYRPNPTLFFYPGLNQQAPWHDASKFEWCETLRQNHDVILKEYLALKENDVQSDYVTAANEHTLHTGDWDWFSYVTKGERQASFAVSCPETTEILESIDGFMTGLPFAYCFFSALKPNSSISPHYAPCNLRLRCHFPLIVPTGVDCAMRVADEVRNWEVAQPLLFDDAYEHEVWYHEHGQARNDALSDRVVLLFDIWHPDLTVEERGAISEMFASVKSQDQDKTKN